MKITNTANEPITLATLFTAQPAGIVAQERRGQAELVESSRLPAKLNSPMLNELKVQNISELYEKLGIKVIGQSKGDNLFLDVQLPKDWKLQSTGHSMWNELLDNKEHIRATIFYKAAFYDRESFLNLNRRYSYTCYEPTDKDGNSVEYGSSEHTHLATFITDSGKPVHLIGMDGKDDRGSSDSLSEQAKAWLEDTYPNYKDYFAYWQG